MAPTKNTSSGSTSKRGTAAKTSGTTKTRTTAAKTNGTTKTRTTAAKSNGRNGTATRSTAPRAPRTRPLAAASTPATTTLTLEREPEVASVEPETAIATLPPPPAPPVPPAAGWWLASDGNWYPPQHQAPAPTSPATLSRRGARAEAKAAKARAKAMRPWYRKKRFLLPLGLVAVIAIVQVAGGGSDDKSPATGGQAKAGVQTDFSTNTDNPPSADVTVNECTTDEVGFVVARGAIVNHTSKRSDYMVSLSFEDGAGTKIAEGFQVVNDVDPGQKATLELNGLEEAPAGGTVTCKLTEVERFAS